MPYEAEPVTVVEAPVAPDGRPGLFAASHCEQVDYRFRVAKDKFDVSRFIAFFGAESEADLKISFAACRTLDPLRLDYHIHFRWQFGVDTIILYISFHSGVFGKTDDEREPYAEQIMAWLGGFFANETAHADMHADFDYSVTERRSRFTLPLRLTISDDIEAEIKGIEVSLDSTPDGVSSAKIRHGRKRLNVELNGSARITFSSFEIQNEVGRLSRFALRMTENKDVK